MRPKHAFLLTVVIGACLGAAAPAAPAPTASWTGFYVNGGAAFAADIPVKAPIFKAAVMGSGRPTPR
jgi:hypothetical protein